MGVPFSMWLLTRRVIAQTLYMWCESTHLCNKTAGENTPTNPIITTPMPHQPPQQQQPPQTPEDQPPHNINKKYGDVGIHDFYCCGRNFIFDVCITDISCHSRRNTDPLIMLKCHEKEEKDKYHNTCLERRMTLVYYIDGIPGRDAKEAEQQLTKVEPPV